MSPVKDYQKLWEERAVKQQEEAKHSQADQDVANETERKIKESHLEQQKAVDEVVAKEKKEKAEEQERRIKEGKGRTGLESLPPSDREQTPALPTNPSDTDPSDPANLSNPIGASEKKSSGGEKQTSELAVPAETPPPSRTNPRITKP
jgi:hypothetical protein